MAVSGISQLDMKDSNLRYDFLRYVLLLLLHLWLNVKWIKMTI